MSQCIIQSVDMINKFLWSTGKNITKTASNWSARQGSKQEVQSANLLPQEVDYFSYKQKANGVQANLSCEFISLHDHVIN